MIRSQDQVGKLPLCRLFSWREDLSMYHETEFVQKETVSGAACSTVVTVTGMTATRMTMTKSSFQVQQWS